MIRTRSKSNLSGYGSTSLTQLPAKSDREIFEGQQHKYDIINNYPSSYRQSIKIFPKFRN